MLQLRKSLGRLGIACLAPWLLIGVDGSARADMLTVEITIENLAPRNGTFLTPLWVGIQDGRFVTFQEGQAASAMLERLAEDGNFAPISQAFTASGDGFDQGVVIGDVSQLPNGTPVGPGPIAPGRKASIRLTLDTTRGMQYLSYASMVVPSNDAFIGNATPTEHLLFDGTTFLGADFIITGADVFDAGSEINTESMTDTAFLGQSMPDTGLDEDGVVRRHVGFLPGGRILSDPNFAAADFTAPGYQIARISVRAVPEPSTVTLMGLGGGILLMYRLRRSRRTSH